ncbi:MAG: hypothetical protein IT381_01085 [Deltaproteobacteria bacterium]|nr:hypothetical protein [Deltaproteobacteria bacterium]
MPRLTLALLLLAACAPPATNEPTPPAGQTPGKTEQTTKPEETVKPDETKPVATPAVDFFIVSADALKASAEKWRDYRIQQGLRASYATVSQIAGDATNKTDVVDAIEKRIHEEATKDGAGKPFFVLLLGDADDKKKVGTTLVPDGTYKDTSGSVSTDNYYADLDDDDMPDLAIGRVAVTTNAEAEVVLSKTMSYESDYEAGEWNRKASVFASEAGFSPQIDQTIENLVFDIVEDLPYDYDFTMTYGKQTSPYVFIPEQFSDKVYERMNEGAMLVTYVGHGSTDAFTNLTWSGHSFDIFDTADLAKLNVQHRSPILSFIACLTGGFAKGESLSERIVKQAGAPVAVLSSTEVSDPVPNAIFVRELGQAMLGEKKATLGEAFVRAKERMIKQKDALRTKISTLASLMYTPTALAALETSHLHMYTLFGDPALKIGRPTGTLTLTVPASVTKGTNLAVSATVSGLAAGDAVVTLEAKRSTLVGTPAAVPADGNASRNAVITANYALANNKRVVTQNVPHDGKTLGATLAVPAGTAVGDYVVKVYAKSGTTDAIASKAIKVQ